MAVWQRVFAAVAVVALGACSHSSGSGTATPTGTPQPSGPTPTPAGPAPQLVAVAPSVGGSSSNTWEIDGSNFSATAAGNVVKFGTHQATVISATTTQLIVSDAFAPVTAAATLPATVAVGSEVSNAITVTAYPDGTVLGLDYQIFHRADQITVTPATLYVLDNSQGLFAVTRSGFGVDAVALNGQDGFATITGGFVSVTGVVYVADESTAAGVVTARLFKQGPSGAFTLVSTFAQTITAATFDANDNTYLVLSAPGAATVEKLDANGTVDAGFGTVAISATAGSIVFENSTVNVLDVAGQQVVQLDPMAGTLTQFAALTGPTGPMVGDGANLFVLDAGAGGEVSEISCCGTVSQFTQLALTNQDGSTHSYTTFTGMGIDANTDVLYLSGGPALTSPLNAANTVADSRIIRLDDANTSNLEMAGLTLPLSVVNDDGVLLAGDVGGCFINSNAVSQGPVFALFTTGKVNQITAGICPLGGLAAAGPTLLLGDSLTNVLEGINLSSGAIIDLADANSGLTTVVAAAADGAGNLYAIGTDSTNTIGGVALIAPGGAVTPNFITSSSVTSFRAGTVVGSQLFLGGLLPTAGNAFAVAPLASGGAATVLPAGAINVDAEFGGMAANAAGTGFYATDAGTGSVFQVSAAGTITAAPVQTNAATGLDLDAFGNLVFGIAAAGTAGSFTALMP